MRSVRFRARKRRANTSAVLWSLAAFAACLPQPAGAADDVDPPTSLMVTVSSDLAQIEKGLTGPHLLQLQPAPRSKVGGEQMTVGCVPCFSIFLSFAFANGRLYAMNWQTDSRRDRYRAVLDGQTLAVEAMSGLRGRDWLDAFAGVDQVPGCARSRAKGKDLDAVLKGAICISE